MLHQTVNHRKENIERENEDHCHYHSKAFRKQRIHLHQPEFAIASSHRKPNQSENNEYNARNADIQRLLPRRINTWGVQMRESKVEVIDPIYCSSGECS